MTTQYNSEVEPNLSEDIWKRCFPGFEEAAKTLAANSFLAGQVGRVLCAPIWGRGNNGKSSFHKAFTEALAKDD